MLIFHFFSLLVFGILIQGQEDFRAERAEPHIRQKNWPPENTIYGHVDDENVAANEIPVVDETHYVESSFSSSTTTHPPPTGPPPIPLPVVNRPLQVTLVAVIMVAAIVANGSVIVNISRDSLKLRMVHFLLIRHVCIADCLGTLLVLPVPIVAMVQGEWRYGETVCAAVSTTTASLWTMHLLAVALYRLDRVLAVWLPPGRYPLTSVRNTNIFLVLVWVGAILGAYGATMTFGHTFQPALALCIPNVPIFFFIIVFACYCIGLVSLTTGYVLAFVRRRRRKRKRQQETTSSTTYPELCDNAPFEPTPDDLMEEVESCGASSERNRHRRALSDQFQTGDAKPAVLTPSNSRLTHRRVWSESAAAYCTSNLSSIVTRSAQMSRDSASFPQSSNDTNINDYERLTEDYGSSDLSVRKLTHSMSFDEASLSSSRGGINNSKEAIQNSEQSIPPRRALFFAQSKSFDHADIVSVRKKRCRFNNNNNTQSMYENILPPPTTAPDIGTTEQSPRNLSKQKSSESAGATNKDFVSDFTPIVKHTPPSGTVRRYPQLDYPIGNQNSLDGDDFSEEHSKRSSRYLNNNIDDIVEDVDIGPMVGIQQHTVVPMYNATLWPVDDTLQESQTRVVVENRSSNFGSGDSLHDVVPPLAHKSSGRQQQRSFFGHHNQQRQQQYYPTSPVRGGTQELYEISNFDDVQPGALPGRSSEDNFDTADFSTNARGASVSRHQVSSGSSNNNNDKHLVNFKGKSGAAQSDNNLQVRTMPKKRPRVRVKHYRHKAKTGPAKRAIASYAVTIGHLLLYLPAMFVVGLKGATLPPGAALLCGIIVYCEFIVQPIALLLVSPRLRVEVVKTVWCLLGGKR